MADISQIVLKDAEGNILGTYDIVDATVPHTSETAESGGLALSLVTTGEKAIWNAKADTDTTYSAGTGLSLSNGAFSVNTGYTTSGNNRAVNVDSNGNLYVTQTDNNTTYTVATGDNNGQIKVTPSSGSAYNVGVKGLGSAAYQTATANNDANTVVMRNGSKYIYATYYNAACGNDNGATSSSYALYANSDNWIRKCSMSKMYSALGGSGCVSLFSGNLASGSQTTFNYGSYSAYVIIFKIDGDEEDYNMFIVPKGKLGTSVGGGYTGYDHYNWIWVQMWYSGSTAYCKVAGSSNNNARVKWIYGLY